MAESDTSIQDVEVAQMHITGNSTVALNDISVTHIVVVGVRDTEIWRDQVRVLQVLVLRQFLHNHLHGFRRTNGNSYCNLFVICGQVLHIAQNCAILISHTYLNAIIV